MSDHDWLCPIAEADADSCWWCPRLRAARADERERIAQAIEANCRDRQPCPWCAEAARTARSGGRDE